MCGSRLHQLLGIQQVVSSKVRSFSIGLKKEKLRKIGLECLEQIRHTERMKWLLPLLIISTVLPQTPQPTLPAMRVSMIALGVTDMAKSVKFYGETLGLQISGKPGELTFFQAGSVTLALNRPLGKAAGQAIAGAVEVIFPVPSVAAAHQALVERGCHFVALPREVTTGTWAATFTDPDGHKLTILGPG